MPQENEKVQVDLYLSNEDKQFLLSRFPSRDLNVTSVQTDGHFVCLQLGDGHTQTPSSLATGPNVEHQQKQVVHSPDHPVRHANASSGDAKEVMVTGSYSSDLHLPSLSAIGDKKGQGPSGNINTKSDNGNIEESTPCTYLQQQDEQTHLLEPTNADGDVELSTVDSSSHSHLPSSKQSYHTSTSEQKGSDLGISNTATAGLPSNKRRASYEETEMRRYTVHCLLHGIEKEPSNYDEMFASKFKKFLNRKPNTVPPTESEDDEYIWYIKDHLEEKCPLFCAQLWKFCTANNLCNLYKFADEGLLLHSKIKEHVHMVGSICSDFANVKSMTVIGKGAFGKVYLYTSISGKRLAIKREIKHPLISSNPNLFKKILELNHPHVIETLEYLVAHSEGDKKKSYLLVMPYMNRKGLDKQFKKEDCDSVLAYMVKYPSKKNFVFRNFLEIFHQAFMGLDYLKTQKLVHRDVKSSNILVQQNCFCESPLICTCPEGNKIYCVLGDMNLLCDEGESSLITSEMWHRMALHEPAGTPRMKAPESYYRTGEDDPVISHKSDVWSGCVTMINVLIGREVNDIPDIQIGIFLRTATKTVGNASKDIDSCYIALGDIIKKYSSILERESVDAAVISDMNALHKKLDKSSDALKKVQAFQGGVPEARDKESPLAGILFTVYVANNLHWKCLTILPDVYNIPLWKCLCDTLDIIAEGVRFIPENRKNASEIVELLKRIKTEVVL